MSHENISAPTVQAEQSTVIASSATAQRSIKLTLQHRTNSSKDLRQHDNVEWSNFTKPLLQPLWQGKDSLAKYRATYDALLEAEMVEMISWRPISTLDPNGPETTENLKRIHAIVFDVEHGIPAHDVGTRLSGIKALVHSTYRHSPDDPRWRVIIPLRTAISHEHWGSLMEHFQAMFGGHLGDIYRHTPFHWFRLPACPHDAVDHYTVMHLDGEVLDGQWTAVAARVARIKRGNTQIPHFEPGMMPAMPAAENAKADPMIEAQQILTRATEPAKAASEESVQSIAQPSESVTHTSSGDETMSAPVVAPAASAPSPTLTSKETAKDLVNDYYFPASHVADDPTTDHDELMDELESLAAEFKKPDDYLRIRDKYCETSEKLNVRGLWAPAFRPDLPIPWNAADLKPAHKLIQIDRVVIDCHWLHSTGQTIQLNERHWRPLFKVNAPFPFELADEFAKCNLANEYRADAVLHLTPLQQFQMRALRGIAVQRQFKAIQQYRRVDGKRVPSLMETATLTINHWCEKDRRVEPHRQKYLALTQARALLEIASPTWKQKAELAGMIRGVPALTESTAREMLGKLDKKLANSA